MHSCDEVFLNVTTTRRRVSADSTGPFVTSSWSSVHAAGSPEGAVVVGGAAVVGGVAVTVTVEGAVVGVPELAQPAAIRTTTAYNICFMPAVLAKE